MDRIDDTFSSREPLAFTEAIKRIGRVLTWIGLPTKVADTPVISTPPDQGTMQTAERRVHHRRAQWERRRADAIATAVGDTPRLLLIEPDQETRLLYACLFEEAGYAVYVVAESRMAIAAAQTRLPDVVVMQLETHADGQILHEWGQDPLTSSIPIVVATSVLHVHTAGRVPGAISLCARSMGPEFLLAEVDKLIGGTPRERFADRQLRRSLMTLRELGQRVKRDDAAQEVMRSLIDRLQVAILALDTEGRYVAVSRGASILTGYTRADLIGRSIFDAGIALNLRIAEGWQEFLARQNSTTKTITLDRSGNPVSLQSEFETILPGLHVATFAG